MTDAWPQPPSALAGRVFEHRFLQYRRTFRASIFSSFLTPVLFLAAMGLGLGTYVDAGRTRRSAACPTWRSWRRACSPPRACSRRRSSRRSRSCPGCAGRGSSTPCTRRRSPGRDIALGNLAWIGAPDAAHRDGLHDRHHRSSGRPASPLIVVRHPGRGADRAGVRGADHGLLRDPEDAREVQRGLPLRDHAAVPVQRHVLPGRAAADAAPARGLAHAAVARRRAGPGAVARDDRRGAARWPSSTCCARRLHRRRRRGSPCGSSRGTLVRG